MSITLDGKVVRAKKETALTARVTALRARGITPHLVIIQVDTLAASSAYIRQKVSCAQTVGVRVTHTQFPASISQEALCEAVAVHNTDANAHGIIVQLPLPSHLSKDAVRTIIDTIDPSKDVDGLTTTNVTKRATGDTTALVPATARGIMSLLAYYHVAVAGANAVVMGRSALVGTPTAQSLAAAGATVQVVHSQTENPASITRAADILIVAIGKPRSVTALFVSPHTVVVDVGISEVDGQLVGDVDAATVAPVVKALSPVPGGVGPLTVVSLIENVIDVAEKR